MTTMDLALAIVSIFSPCQSVTGSLSINATSLSTKAVKGLMCIFENSIRPFRIPSSDPITFLATKVWTAGVCNRIQQANSSAASATTIPQNIFRAFFNNLGP